MNLNKERTVKSEMNLMEHKIRHPRKALSKSRFIKKEI